MINPLIAAIISFFLPGIGEVIQGKQQRGGMMFLIAIIIWCLIVLFGNYIYGIAFIYSLYAAYDTYRISGN